MVRLMMSLSTAEDFFYNYYTICEMSVFDGSYLKLREAHLTYNFPKSILEKTKCIKAAHVSFGWYELGVALGA